MDSDQSQGKGRVGIMITTYKPPYWETGNVITTSVIPLNSPFYISIMHKQDSVLA